jgi:MinD-like ATPase involved in chromosome partitioning or flagellar assembly
VGNLILLSSIVQGNGSKYATVNIAYELLKILEKKEKNKILLIDFDIECPTLGMSLYLKSKKSDLQELKSGIDDIVEKINLNILNQEIFLDTCTNIDIGLRTNIPLYILKGTNVIGKYKAFTKEVVEKIISYAKNSFDYVFVVSNNKSNNAGLIFSLNESNEIIILAKNNYSNIENFDKTMSLFNQYKNKDSKISILYNYGSNPKCDIGAKVLNYEISSLGILEYNDKDVDNLNLTQKSIFYDGPNKEIFKKIAKSIYINYNNQT